ncbi:TlpA family protein disulfide reductase [Nonlabens marinus]|uniref:Disulfide interchange protein tlpA n=1 Tax=Nonlabens marinus S1-08 TaxID=1454201 RepID=W8W027_9FLAO|nr:TlpA disulfide reductase family protein [Nonlabens marinus]BAO55596.1 disulfide interchange protein tlpA [Nonlabens marinus S1-08]
MKKYFAVLLLTISLYACNKEEEAAVDGSEKNTIIVGRINGAESVDLHQLTAYAYDYLSTDYEEYSAELSANGDFRFDIPMTQAAELTIVGRTPFSVFAVPGDSIHISVSSKEDIPPFNGRYQFTGDRQVANERLMVYKESFPLDVQQFYDSQEPDAMQAFLAYMDAGQKTLKDFNSEFLKDIDDDVLTNYIKAQENFYIPTTRLDFANYRSYYGLESPDADGAYYKFIENIPAVKHEDLVNTGTMQRLIYNLTYHLRSEARATADGEMDDNDMDLKAIEIATAKKNTGLLYDYVIHDLVYASLNDHNIVVYEKAKEKINSRISEPRILESISSRYQEEKDLLKSPELPEGAELLTFESENPENYLEEIVANANGKVIYIDNWATWCGPCKVEFKEASPQLHQKFEEDVEFIYLCHNSERRAYIPYIAQFKIKGKHYFLEDEASEVISRQINLEGFPTYTIFNKKGEIVQSDYIHRPSYPATTDLLTKLVNE